MINLILTSVIICLVVGLIIKYLFETSYLEITWFEYWVTGAIISVIVIPVITLIGWNMAKNNRMTYHEFINGWELTADKQITKCYRDGLCHNTYSCDPYVVPVTYTYRCGKSTCTGVRLETRYHDCPYTNEEWSYSINTTLGRFGIDYNRLPDNPQQNRWRSYVNVPRSVIERAGVGDHPFWLDAKKRIDSGHAGPVTKKHSYINYVLASEYSILKSAKNDVAYFKKEQLLPSPTTTDKIQQYYHAKKIYQVGTITNFQYEKWNDRLEYLNAQLGYQLNGDLHLVITSDARINGNPDRYLNALKAWWQDPDSTDKNSLSKNGVLVVLGVANDTVQWSRATTGMPVGNEILTKMIQSNLKNVPFTVDAVIGQVSIDNNRGKLSNPLVQSGVLSELVLVKNPYERVPMEKFSYLKGEIRPKSGAKIWIVVITILLASLLWIIPLNTDYNYSHEHREFHAPRISHTRRYRDI